MTQRLEAIEAPLITVYNEGLHILDTGGDHDLIIKPGSDLAADRITGYAPSFVGKPPGYCLLVGQACSVDMPVKRLEVGNLIPT